MDGIGDFIGALEVDDLALENALHRNPWPTHPGVQCPRIDDDRALEAVMESPVPTSPRPFCTVSSTTC